MPGDSAESTHDEEPRPNDGDDSSTPAPDAARRALWQPVLSIVAAILVGAGAIAAAIIIGLDRLGESSSTGAQAKLFAGPACKAWESARRELEAIPPLPSGGDLNAPDIDKALSEQRTAVGPVLNTFERRINDLPEDEITTLAKRYIQAQRDKMERQANRTATAIDLDMVNAGYTMLNRACGLPG